MKSGRVFLALTLLSAVLLISCSGDPRIDLSHEWKTFRGDNASFRAVDFDDSSWDTISLPNIIDREKKRQTIWLRRDVVIPEHFRDTDIALFIGKIWDVEQTHVNGVKIGSAGRDYPDFFSEWNFFRYYHIPPEIIKYGATNTIAVRMFTNQFALWNDSPFISTLKEVKLTTFWKRLAAEHIPMALGILTLLVAMASLLQFFFDRSNTLALHFAGISFLWFILTFHYFMPDFYFMSFNMQDNVYYALLTVEIVWIYLFIEKVLDTSFKPVRYFMFIVLPIAVTVCLTATPESPITGWRFDLIGGFGVISQLIWGGLIIRAIMKKNREARIMLFAYVIFMISLIHDSLSISNIIFTNVFWNNFGYPSIILAFGAILSLRVVDMSRQIALSSEEIEIKNRSLLDVLESVKDSIVELTEFSATIQSTAVRLQDDMSEQGGSLEQTGAAIDEVSATIESISDNARRQEETIRRNKDLLLDYITSINRITEAAKSAVQLSYKSQGQTQLTRKNLEEVREVMMKIMESSGAIKEITEVINDISEKTNLLSLNASIEAARAGQYGRGFAVVADEIGKLADSSIQQSKSIQAMIRDTVEQIERETGLIINSSGSILDVEQAVNNVNAGIDTILDLCVSQEDITRSAQKNMEIILQGSSEIAAATEQEKMAIFEVRKAIDHLTGITGGVNSRVMTMVESLEKLYRRISLLKETVKRDDALVVKSGG